jgi:head-tail adaptor
MSFASAGLIDPFDSLLIQSVAVLEKETYVPGEGDGYGQPDQTFTTKIASWPARVSTNKGGQEYKQGKESAKNTFLVFMRPPSQDDSHAPFTLSTHHWLQFTDVTGTVHTLNITGVNDPSFLGHHLEAKCEEYLP